MSTAPELDIDGPVYRPGDDGYRDQIDGYNRIVQHRPQLVVVPRHPHDVEKAVRYAVANDLSVAVQATGHGVSRPADGVLIRTHQMVGIHIDADTRTATVEAGVLGRDLVRAAAAEGLLPLGGSSPDVGVIGYHLGGGIALLGRAYGYGADRVRSVDLVTADGELRTVTPERDADLFWAVLGCRGNFGVVTAITVELLPITTVTGGGLWFTGEAIDDAARAYLRWTTGIPDSMCSSLLLIRMPDFEAIPAPIRGRRIAHIRIVDSGDAGKAQATLAVLRAALPSPVMDTVQQLPAAHVGSIHNEPPGPTVFEGRSSILDRLDDAAIDALLARAGSDGDDRFLVELRHLEGALRPPAAGRRGQAVIGRRDGSYLLYTGSNLADLTREEAVIAQNRLHADMQPWGTGGIAAAFLAGEHVTQTELRSAYTEHDWDRLRELKSEWDPTNLFRINQNVPPR